MPSICGSDGAVAKSSANGLVGTGNASQYRLQPRAGFLKAQRVDVRPIPSSVSLTSNRDVPNYLSTVLDTNLSS